MRNFLIASTLLVLAGCSSFQPDIERRPLEVDRVLLHIIPDETDFDSAWHNGDASWEEIDGLRYCTVRLRDYPFMLGHEVDHCFRGEWHDGNPNDDDFG